MSNSLAVRYNVGSNAGPNFGVLAPGSHEAQFFLGMPRSQAQLVQLGAHMNAQMGRGLETLKSIDGHARNHTFALNEISSQVAQIDRTFRQGFENVEAALDQVSNTLDRGFSTMAEAIFFLEASTAAHLTEIKTALGQVDDHLAELVHLTTFPREAESSELIAQGSLALATGNIDDAEAIFREAIEKNRTSFQGHMNMAFVMLHTDDAEAAITHFKKALDYAPQSEDGKPARSAAASLARAYFATENFLEAQETMALALKLHQKEGAEKRENEYEYGVYSALSGNQRSAIEIILKLCKQDPKFFAIATTDADLECIQDSLMAALNELARDTHEIATKLLNKKRGEISDFLEKIEYFRHRGADSRIAEFIRKAEGLLGKEDYSNSVEVSQVCEDLNTEIGVLDKAWRLYVAAESRARSKLDDARSRAEQLISYHQAFTVEKSMFDEGLARVEKLLKVGDIESVERAFTQAEDLVKATKGIDELYVSTWGIDRVSESMDSQKKLIAAMNAKIVETWRNPQGETIKARLGVFKKPFVRFIAWLRPRL